jgi:hypothetical protein
MSRFFPSAFVATLAEERIQAALRRGDFDDLPGAGRPLDLDDDRLVPPEVRIACRILKSAGCVPAEVLERREIAELEAALPRLADPAARRHAIARLALLRTHLGARQARRLSRNPRVEREVVARLARR